jgi:transposase
MTYGAKFVIDYLSERVGIRIAKQIIYVILLAFGVERKKIRESFGASDVTLCKYNAALKDEDLTRIFEHNYNRPQSELEAYRDKIECEFETNPPSTRREAAIRIEKMTGIKRSLPRIGKFLKKGASKVVR